jgi:hypothetical protein
MSATMPSTSPLVDNRSFERDYHPLKWKTVMSWEKDGILRVIRIGRKRFLRRQDIEALIQDGGKQFAGGWRRQALEA